MSHTVPAVFNAFTVLITCPDPNGFHLHLVALVCVYLSPVSCLFMLLFQKSSCVLLILLICLILLMCLVSCAFNVFDISEVVWRPMMLFSLILWRFFLLVSLLSV